MKSSPEGSTPGTIRASRDDTSTWQVDFCSAMVQNPRMRVFVASGYFDLATPHFAADYVIDHLGLEPGFMDHVTVDYYPAGHMMYVNDDLRVKLSEDVRRWLRSAAND